MTEPEIRLEVLRLVVDVAASTEGGIESREVLAIADAFYDFVVGVKVGSIQ